MTTLHDAATDELAEARDYADRLFNAVIVLYGAAQNRCYTEMTQPEADLNDRVLRRAEQDMGPAVVALVNIAIENRICADWNLPRRKRRAAPGVGE